MSSKDYKTAQAAKKPPLDMIPEGALIGAARVFQYGAKKYAPGNFLNATLADGAVARYIGALRRHLREMQGLCGRFLPENAGALDSESGLPHIDHAICGLVMLRAILIKEGVLSEDPLAWTQGTAPRAEPRHDLAEAPSISISCGTFAELREQTERCAHFAGVIGPCTCDVTCECVVDGPCGASLDEPTKPEGVVGECVYADARPVPICATHDVPLEPYPSRDGSHWRCRLTLREVITP